MKEINGQIDEIGLCYIGHFNTYQLEVAIKTVSNYIRPIIPLDRIDQFIELFPEINWEDGYMLYKLKGTYLRCIVDDNRKLIALKHIIKEVTYTI